MNIPADELLVGAHTSTAGGLQNTLYEPRPEGRGVSWKGFRTSPNSSELNNPSLKEGVSSNFDEGRGIRATTIQLFTTNQKHWQAKNLDKEAVDLWHQALQETGLKKIMSHNSYLVQFITGIENIRDAIAPPRHPGKVKF